jgi:hypothetical protein
MMGIVFWQSGGAEGVFQEADEALQAEATPSGGELAALVGGAFACLCDVKQAGGSTYYRLSDAKARPRTWHCSHSLHPPDASYPFAVFN